MQDTPNLKMPYLMPSQAQKHVTHNDALRALDVVVQLSVLDRHLATPPVTPNEGDRYIVASSATGAWAGHEGAIAAFQDGSWAFYQPTKGWLAWIDDENLIQAFDGTDWLTNGLVSINPVNMAGINTSADLTNRLAVKSDAVLFSHDDATPGTGDIRAKLNKATGANSATFLFQDNWSARAEIGLAGDDDLRAKVSPDGSTWHTSFVADCSSGAVAFPSGTKHGISGAAISSLILVSGGAGQTTIWRLDAPRTGIPRQATINAVSGDKITLTAAAADQFFANATMQNVSYVRIWNASKSPEQPAWIRARGTTSELHVLDAAQISGWTSGETIRIGDGTHGHPNAAAVDISLTLQNRLGSVFRQTGLDLVITGSTAGGAGNVAAAPAGGGSAFTSVYIPNDGSLCQTTGIVRSTELSPISNSNLVFVREMDNGTGALRVGGVTIAGIYV